MKRIPVLAVACLVFVLGMTLQNCENRRYKAPPPGWSIVEDGQGNYGARRNESGYVMDNDMGEPLKSRQEAIDRAWRRHDWEQREIREAARNPKPKTPPKKWMEAE